jgi:opacity protein-like surface antigen
MKGRIFTYSWLIVSVIFLLGTCRFIASGQTSPFTPEPLISNTVGFGASAGYAVCPNAHIGAPQLQFLSRIRLGAVVGFEGMVGYTGEHRFSFITAAGEDLSASVHRIPVTGSLLLFIPLAPTFTPYLVGGVGAHYVILDYSEDINEAISDKSKTRFGYHLGAGLEIPLNEHVAILGDYRYLYVDNAFEEELQIDFSSAEYRSNHFSAGVVVYF